MKDEGAFLASLFVAGLFSVAVLGSPSATAQGFKPNRPVEIVTHTGPGGGGDVVARSIATTLEKENLLPVRMNVINKPGGSGAAATAYMAEKKGDTHTLGLFTSLWLSGPLASKESRIHFHEMTPIARLITDASMIAVKADSPYKTVAEFIEAAKKAPGKMKQAGGSIDARDNLVRILLQRSTGASWSYIPFPAGSDRIAAVLGGHVDIYIPDIPEAKDHVRSGSLRMLAQATERRMVAYSNVPTLREAGYSIPVVGSMRGIVGPPGISRDVVEYWENVFERMVKTPSWRKYLEENQVEDGFQKGAALTRSAEEFIAQRREIFKEAGIQTYR
jgi:putative tricarboxylic transport membrane protein